MTAHIVWVTKYRYPILVGDVEVRCCDLIRQIFDVEDVRILTGVISKDHIHIQIEYRPKLSISNLVKRLKGRTFRHLQQGFPDLGNRYWGRHMWAIGYGVWSTGNITDEMVQEYLEHHRNADDRGGDNIIPVSYTHLTLPTTSRV